VVLSSAAVGVHPLVATEVRELRVRLVAHLARERLDRCVNVRVLLEATRACEALSALGTNVDVVRRTCAVRVRFFYRRTRRQRLF